MESIVVEDLHKRYGAVHAVQGISFTVGRGEIFGLIGPNGAGKTTTIEIMEGLRTATSGRVRVLGLDPHTQGRELRERIGIQFQANSLQDKLRVREALDLFSTFYRRRTDLSRLIADLGLEEKLNSYFKDLSGGWKQRVTLALAALNDPEVIFLDEPSTGLDPQARRDLWAVVFRLRERGTTVVLTTHYMEEAERLCDRVGMVNGGKLVAVDTPSRLLERLAGGAFISLAERPEIQVPVLQALPEVKGVECRGGLIRVYADDLQRAGYAIFRAADELGWKLENFRFESGTLDDLFVQLVERKVGA
jgi:ABC-2 type transport system ATP-binding protein